jgi:hypothetical protein
VEDTTTPGALGGRIAQALAAIGSATCAATVALPPRFLPHASRAEILRSHGLDAAGITTTVHVREIAAPPAAVRQRQLRVARAERWRGTPLWCRRGREAQQGECRDDGQCAHKTSARADRSSIRPSYL